MMSYDIKLPSWDEMSPLQQDAAEYAWQNGCLDFLIMSHQKELWAIICAHVGLSTDFECPAKYKDVLSNAKGSAPLMLKISRRYGKSSLALLAQAALCLLNSDHTYYFVAPTEGDAKDIFQEVMPALLKTCPPYLRPKKLGISYTFHTGSRIKIGGTFNGAEGLRGRAAHGVIIDEAGSIPEHGPTSCLKYVMGSIIGPQLATTQGWEIISSTPPADLQHGYYEQLLLAEQENRLVIKTIYDNTSFTPERIEQLKKDSYSADPSGSAWDREYLCVPRPDAATLIIPEETQTRLKTEPVERPQHFHWLHRYIVQDHGTVDLNVTLFGWWDYTNARLVVERELIIRGSKTTKLIAKAIKEERESLWNDLPIERAVCDAISHQIVVDLNAEFNDIYFNHPSKTILLSDNANREGMVNQLISAIDNEQIWVAPECEMLLETIKTGQWTISKGKREFGRFNQIGHCDALAALVYLWRAIDRNTNPLLGRDMPLIHEGAFYLGGRPQVQTAASSLAKALNRHPVKSVFDRS